MQSPIDSPDRPDDSNAKAATAVRIVVTPVEQTVGQYLIVDGGNVDKLGDAVALGNGEFLVIPERDDLAGHRRTSTSTRFPWPGQPIWRSSRGLRLLAPTRGWKRSRCRFCNWQVYSLCKT